MFLPSFPKALYIKTNYADSGLSLHLDIWPKTGVFLLAYLRSSTWRWPVISLVLSRLTPMILAAMLLNHTIQGHPLGAALTNDLFGCVLYLIHNLLLYIPRTWIEPSKAGFLALQTRFTLRPICQLFKKRSPHLILLHFTIVRCLRRPDLIYVIKRHYIAVQGNQLSTRLNPSLIFLLFPFNGSLFGDI